MSSSGEEDVGEGAGELELAIPAQASLGVEGVGGGGRAMSRATTSSSDGGGEGAGGGKTTMTMGLRPMVLWRATVDRGWIFCFGRGWRLGRRRRGRWRHRCRERRTTELLAGDGSGEASAWFVGMRRVCGGWASGWQGDNVAGELVKQQA